MFRQWGHRDVDHDRESNAEPGIEMERGPKADLVCRMARNEQHIVNSLTCPH